MDRHELAIKTYEDLQKRKKAKELRHKIDLQSVGWNGITKYKNNRLKRYYNTVHSS